jgi:cullin 3
MYSLFSRVPAGLNEMRTFISNYILTLGAEINQHIMSDLKSKAEKGSSSIAINWVMEVLALQDKFDKILDQAASKDKSFQTVFNEAFEKFINENQKSAEFISLFIDENLKKGLKGVSKICLNAIKSLNLTLINRNLRMRWTMSLIKPLHYFDFCKTKIFSNDTISNIWLNVYY